MDKRLKYAIRRAIRTQRATGVPDDGMSVYMEIQRNTGNPSGEGAAPPQPDAREGQAGPPRDNGEVRSHPTRQAVNMLRIDKAFRIATPMRKASWTKRFAAGWGERRRASGDGGSGEGG